MSLRDRYASAAAFRHALDARLASRAADAGDRERLRRNAAYERFLARLFAEGEASPWIVKGGYALDVRLATAARRTKDLDLSFPRSPSEPAGPNDAFERLVEAARLDLSDWFTFRIVKRIVLGSDNDEIDVCRFTVEATIGTKLFVTFLVDVGVEGLPATHGEWTPLPAFFDFAGEAPPRVRLVSSARHLAEKLHALTRPRGTRENTRVKDLVDIILFMDVLPPQVEELREAVRHVFDSRATHPVPLTLSSLPTSWIAPYARLAVETGVTSKTLAEAERRARELWSKVNAE